MVLVKESLKLCETPRQRREAGEVEAFRTEKGSNLKSGLCAFITLIKSILDDGFKGATWSLLRSGDPK